MRIESAPRLGPTVRSSAIVMSVGSAPARSSRARSLASAFEKLPEIEPVLLMRDWMTGADEMRPSSEIARKRPTFSPVARANSRAPRLFSVKLTCQRPGRSLSAELRASVNWSPLMIGWVSTR